MGPREKKKESSSPRKQMSIDGFFKPVAQTPQKRPRDEEPGGDKQSPSKKPKETQVENNNEIDPTAANNNNNNNNNACKKEKALGQKGVDKSPDGGKSKEKRGSEVSVPKASPKKEKTSTPQKVTVSKKEKVERMDDVVYTEEVESYSVDEDGVIPHPLISIPESDQLVIVPQEDDDSAVQESDGEFIGPDDIPGDSDDFRDAEEENVPDLLPMSDASVPASSQSNELDSRILTPSPSPSPQVAPKTFKCKVCDEWFPNRYFQRKHMLMEHEDQLYECRVCSYNSCDPEKLKSHIIKMHVAKKERTELVTIDEAQYDLDELITKQTPRKVIMEDGVALGRDPSSKMRFICAMCTRIYTSKYSLERHVRCHTGEKPYTCDVCNFTTSYREHMQRHMTSVHLIVHSDEPKQKYVPKRQKKTEEKNVSTEDDDNDNDMVIVTGDENNADESHASESHAGESHAGENETGENLINESLADEDDPDENPEGESHEGSFESLNSSDTTSSSNSKKRRNILRKRFECAACGLKATHKTDLIDHIREKHPNAHIESLENGDGSKVHLIVTASKKPNSSRRMVITCPNCFMIFHDTWKYKVHMRSHTGVKPFGCSLCEFRATSKMTIRDHVHRKHKDNQNPKILLRTVGIDGTVQHVELNFPQREFKCDVCEEVFKDNYHMKQHKKKSHTESLPFSCVECGHREWARANIIIHCLQTHPDLDVEGLVLRNNKPFTVGPHKLPKCDVCDKVFSYQSQLYLHQRQHTGERNYVCDICNYRTNHKPALQKHIEKHLTGPESTPPPKKTNRRKNTSKDPKEPEGPINFVEVEENTCNVIDALIKKEGAKKKKEKVKRENEKVKKENEKVKKDNVKVKKDNVKVKKEKDKNKKDSTKDKKEKAAEKEKGSLKEKKKATEKEKGLEKEKKKVVEKEKGLEKEKKKVVEKEKGSEKEKNKVAEKEKGSEKEKKKVTEKEKGSEKELNKVAEKEKALAEKAKALDVYTMTNGE